MAGGLSDFIKANKHYGIERFGIVFGILSMSLLAIIIVFSVQGHEADVKADLAQTIYTSKSVSSVDGVTLDVTNVCRSADGTHAMILAKVDTEDSKLSDISTDATAYDCRVMAINERGTHVAMQSAPMSGNVYVFGTTGYIGIYINCPNGVKRERLLVGLETSYLAKKSDTADKDTWTMMVNLGADAAQVCDSLDAKTFDPTAFYAETIMNEQDTKLRATCDDDLQQMADLLTQINEAQSRVRKNGVTLDGMVPSYVYGDKITGTTDALTLETDTVAFGGFDCDWRSTDINGSYMAAACGSDKTLDFLKYMKAGADTTVSSQELDPYTVSKKTLTSAVWLMSDGSAVSSASKDVQTSVTELTGYWNRYMELKYKYQCTDVYALMTLEMQKSVIADTYTVSQGDDAFQAFA